MNETQSQAFLQDPKLSVISWRGSLRSDCLNFRHELFASLLMCPNLIPQLKTWASLCPESKTPNFRFLPYWFHLLVKWLEARVWPCSSKSPFQAWSPVQRHRIWESQNPKAPFILWSQSVCLLRNLIPSVGFPLQTSHQDHTSYCCGHWAKPLTRQADQSLFRGWR